MGRQRMRGTAVAIMGPLLALIGLTGCSSTPSTAPSPVATHVSIAQGRTIYVECSGSGTPPIILISGQGLTADGWMIVPDPDDSTAIVTSDKAVYRQLAQTSYVCAYDRPNTTAPGESRSTPVDQPVTAVDSVADLHEWLTAAGVPAPYVLVGHSYGGMVAVLYARTYPSETAGLVLVDPANEFLRDTAGRTWWDDVQKQVMASVDPAGPERADFDASADALASSGPPPDVPTVVLTSDHMPPTMIDEEHFAAWVEAHRRLAEQFSATHVTQTDSGHNIMIEQPDLVMDAIRTVLESAQQ